ncbi:MAG: nucleotide exchange factor GrpE [Terrimicrobiaceae bacterium]|nr:nucleotide exchange factor GrpE [Terrimicrobiaceae bacterium]
MTENETREQPAEVADEARGDSSTSAEQPEAPSGSPAAPDLQAEVEKFKDLALRAHAELDNFRKRAAREKEEAIRFGNARLIESLLPILDSFDLGFQSAREAREAAAVVSGFEMVRRQLADWLREAGVETIEAAGMAFDPARHEAVSQEPSDSAAEGIVIRQLRPGYILRGRLLRPASVVVSSGPTPEP